jgi:AraC-like DNA-binding protein
MIDLERRISGDWIEAREASSDQYTLTHFFQLDFDRLHDIARSLRLSVEEGVLEYKGSILRPVFVALENMQYQSVRFEELAAHERPLEELLFTTLLQRLVCTGAILPAKIKLAQPVSTDALQVNAILADIKNRIRQNPEAQKHPAVKNIFVQVTLYKKERKKMEELLPMIKDELRGSFRANFQKTFRRIFDSIRKNYADLLTEEETSRLQQESRSDIMYRASLKSLSPLLAEQAKEVSRLRSTLSFARTDKYKTRAILVGLYKNKGSYLGLLDKEGVAYGRLCHELASEAGIDCPATLGRRLGGELVRVLEKLARLEAPPQSSPPLQPDRAAR